MNVADWLDNDEVLARLVAAKIRPECAEASAPYFVDAAAAMGRLGINKDAPVIACWVPGRIEVLGKHTDYCGGESVLAAAERGFCMVAAPRNDSTIRIVDAGRHESSEFEIGDRLEPQIGDWSNYPQTVARRFAKNFPQARRGATIAFASNLPPSSGMSSSSAFVVGTFLLLATINHVDRDNTYMRLIRALKTWPAI